MLNQSYVWRLSFNGRGKGLSSNVNSIVIKLVDAKKIGPYSYPIASGTYGVHLKTNHENIYPLVICYIAIENDHRIVDLPINSMVIFP